MIVPPRLSPGAPVTVIAPSGTVPPDRFEAGLARLATRYAVRWTPRIYDQHGYLAGDDDARLAELMLALESDTHAILCARGGYGTMRLLDRIDPAIVRAAEKLLVGFSDITALHALWLNAGVACVHAPTATQVGELPVADLEALFACLEGALPAAMEGLTSVGTRATVSGPLVGGNLEVVKSLVGTPFAFPLAGAVLFLEEVGERPYRIDRSITQLALSGQLRDVSAVVVGGLTRCTEPNGRGPTAEEVVVERLSSLGIPVLMGLPVGHGERNLPLSLGRRVTVDGTTGSLRFLETATR